MLKIRNLFLVLVMLLCTTANADVRISIGINVPVYPDFVVVPGYPVYYAPRMQANMFFYDGLYWVYQNDNWYESSWYNGPWWLVYPEDVPLFILRIPVRYYRMPPAYFIGWQFDAPPRWGDYWGRDWNQHRRGWDRWDRRYVPAPAPLPAYQRQYSGDRYPRQLEQQRELQQKNYRFQPRDPEVRKQYQEQSAPRAPVQQNIPQQERHVAPERQGTPDGRGSNQIERQRVPEDRGSSQKDNRRYEPSPPESSQQTEPRRQDRSDTPRSRSPQDGGVRIERSPQADTQQGRTENQAARNQSSRQQQGQEVLQREQNEPKSQGQKNKQQSDDRPRGQDRSQDRGKGRDD